VARCGQRRQKPRGDAAKSPPSSACARPPRLARAKENKQCCNPHAENIRKEQKAATPVIATRWCQRVVRDFGLKATERGRLTARQIEAARRAIRVT
jgi:hypothetical protein